MTEPRLDARARVQHLAAGFAIAWFASLSGIGGGLFAVPFLHYRRGLELKRAIATSLVLVLATTVAATGTELLRPEPELHFGLVVPLVVGMLVGAQLGFLASERTGIRPLKLVFALLLAYASWRLLLGGQGVHTVVSDYPAEPSTGELGLAFLAGLGGGFVAPLLGVGGGLVMVPVLFLSIGWLGFSGARACSLAGSTIGTARALFLHARAGRVRWDDARWLALGALVGAAVGVGSLDFAGVVEVGRYGLGILVLVIAGRFALDLLKPEPGAQA